MTYAHRKDAWREQLWNVSLLPIVQVPPATPPPVDPAPGGGTTLNKAALLSMLEDAPSAPLAEAA
jgi:hypothetical protein